MKKEEIIEILKKHEKESNKAYKLRYSQGEKNLAEWHHGYNSAIKESIDLVKGLK